MRRRLVHLVAPISGPPLPPRAHQRKVQAYADALGSELAGQLGIAVQLRTVAVDFPIQEFVEAAPRMLAGLVIDPPPHAVFVDETAIEHHAHHVALPSSRQRVLAEIVARPALQYPA